MAQYGSVCKALSCTLDELIFTMALRSRHHYLHLPDEETEEGMGRPSELQIGSWRSRPRIQGH